MLGISAAAVKSTLQRARARINEVAADPESDLIEPTEPQPGTSSSHVYRRFRERRHRRPGKGLRTDAAIELVGTRTWFSGRVTCLRFSRT